MIRAGVTPMKGLPMHKIGLPLVGILCALPLAGHAQDGPTFDCAKAESSAEKLICEDPALATLDRQLADRFNAAVAAAQSMDVGAKEAEDTLRATQRGWIKGRDECWKEPDLRACVETEYLRRDAELTARFMLEAPRMTELICGDGARALSVYEFASPLPGIRVEEGDSIYVGAQMSADTPRAYYVVQWGGVTFGDDGPVVEDVYAEQTACRIAG